MVLNRTKHFFMADQIHNTLFTNFSSNNAGLEINQGIHFVAFGEMSKMNTDGPKHL